MIILNSNKKFYFMCLNCYELIKAESNLKIHIGKSWLFYLPYNYSNKCIHINCLISNNGLMISLDKNIARSVQWLNKHNYLTVSSSEGFCIMQNNAANGISLSFKLPYIRFNKSYKIPIRILNKIKNAGWKYDNTNKEYNEIHPDLEELKDRLNSKVFFLEKNEIEDQFRFQEYLKTKLLVDEAIIKFEKKCKDLEKVLKIKEGH